MGEPTKEYLSDSVYARVEDGSSYITLTTENGLPNDPSNTIYLNSDVIKALKEFIDKHLTEGGG